MSPYWFHAKRYGWGWVPATWQGWLVLVGFVFAEVVVFWQVDHRSHSVSDTLTAAIPRMLALLALLVAICWSTGEPLRWRWGKGR